MRSVHPDSIVVIDRLSHLALDCWLMFAAWTGRSLPPGAGSPTSSMGLATAVVDLHGVGPIVAGFILGHTGDVTRFATADRYASYNATAPVEASSGPTVRHRLNQRGNRQLNHAMHIAAIVQICHDSPGRAYYHRKLAEGKRPKKPSAP